MFCTSEACSHTNTRERDSITLWQRDHVKVVVRKRSASGKCAPTIADDARAVAQRDVLVGISRDRRFKGRQPDVAAIADREHALDRVALAPLLYLEIEFDFSAHGTPQNTNTAQRRHPPTQIGG